MRITIIFFVGILSYLVVVLPGYYFIVQEGAEKISKFGTLTELLVVEDAKSSPKQSVVNPGDAPPLK